jgi:hypothetical protein
VQLPGADRPHAQRGPPPDTLLDPAVEIRLSDRPLDGPLEPVAPEAGHEVVVDRPEHRFGQLARLQSELVRRLHHRVLVQRQPWPELGEEVDDVVDRRVMQVAQLARIGESELTGVPDRVRRAEARADASAVLNAVLAGGDDPPADQERDVDDRRLRTCGDEGHVRSPPRSP